MKKALIFLCVLSIVAIAIPAFADIINGGFEDGLFTGWSSTGDTSLTSAGYDPRAGGTNLSTVGVGTYSAKVGDQIAWQLSNQDPPNGPLPTRARYSSIYQQFTVGNGFTDLYFAWAAVGLVPTYTGFNNPYHSVGQTPWFQIKIDNVTQSKNLFTEAYYTGNLYDELGNPINGITPGWVQGVTHNSALGDNGAGIWYYRPWNTFHLDLAAAGVLATDQLLVTLTAQDCSLGSHSSYAYLDGFGTSPPLATPEPSTMLLFGFGLIGVAVFRKRS
jgi:hypothetical protein